MTDQMLQIFDFFLGPVHSESLNACFKIIYFFDVITEVLKVDDITHLKKHLKRVLGDSWHFPFLAHNKGSFFQFQIAYASQRVVRLGLNLYVRIITKRVTFKK